jgi:hypothetical protein
MRQRQNEAEQSRPTAFKLQVNISNIQWKKCINIHKLYTKKEIKIQRSPGLQRNYKKELEY